MVAYTSNLCLPFFEGGDSPCLNTGTVCEPSTVFCDLMALVESSLDAIDLVVQRTATAIPLASISYIPPTPVAIPGDGTIPFNIVNMDTDDMVDLTAFAGITPRRNGVYRIDVRVLYEMINLDEFPEAILVVGTEQTPTTLLASRSIADGVTRGIGVSSWVYAGSLWPFGDVSPQPRSVSVQDLYAIEFVQEAHLDVSWHSELD